MDTNSGRYVSKPFEKTADRLISAQQDDSEVEKLLEEMSDHNLLSLNLGSHTVHKGSQNSKDLHDYGHLFPSEPDTSGLEGELASRFAKLKKKPSGGSCSTSSNNASESITNTKANTVGLNPPGNRLIPVEDVDTLGNELASRLQALRADSKPQHVSKPSSVSGEAPFSNSSASLPPSRPRQAPSVDRQNFNRAQQIDKSTRVLPRVGKAGTTGMPAGLRNPPHKPSPAVNGQDTILREADSLTSSGRQYSTSRSFWGKGRRRTEDTIGGSTVEKGGEGVRGWHSKDTKDLLEDGRDGEEVDEREVESMLTAMGDELHLQSKQISLSHSVASGSGYLCEDEDECESDASDSLVQEQVDSIIEWAKDAVALEGKTGKQSAYEEEEENQVLKAEGSQNRTWKGLENDHEDHGYSQDDEEGESVRKGKGTAKMRGRKP